MKLEKIDIGVLNRERAYLNVSMEQALFTAATTGSEGQSNVFLSLPTWKKQMKCRRFLFVGALKVVCNLSSAYMQEVQKLTQLVAAKSGKMVNIEYYGQYQH